MTSITVDFKFEIGDLVYIKGANHSASRQPIQFCVYERIAQQCHGGIQMLYKLDGREGLHAETVLTKDEPPYRPMSEAALQERRYVAKAERMGRDDWFSELKKKTHEPTEGGD